MPHLGIYAATQYVLFGQYTLKIKKQYAVPYYINTLHNTYGKRSVFTTLIWYWTDNTGPVAWNISWNNCQYVSFHINTYVLLDTMHIALTIRGYRTSTIRIGEKNTCASPPSKRIETLIITTCIVYYWTQVTYNRMVQRPRNTFARVSIQSKC